MNLPCLVDLHCHSTASDGSLSPEEVVQTAFEEGVGLMALTDHDTLAGLPAARAKAAALGLDWIDGIELSAKWDRGHFHLLGYGINPQHRPFLAALEHFQEGRRLRSTRILEKLDQLGMPLTRQDLRVPPGQSPARPHLAQAMLDRGYVTHLEQAFELYLRQGGLAYVDKETLTPQEAIQLVLEAGGLPVLAHPVSLYLKYAELGEKLKQLKAIGLAGIEAYNSSHQANQSHRLVRLADELGLLVTGGSDFHGKFKPQVRMGRLKKGRKILSKWISPDFFATFGATKDTRIDEG